MASLAGVAILAIKVRFDGALVSWLYSIHVIADFQHLYSQLVSGDAGIGKERHLAEISADIGAANSDTSNTYEYVIGTRLAWIGNVYPFPVLGLFELKCFHRVLSTLIVFGKTFDMADILHRRE
jgi:hypothetical protein